MSLVGGLVLRRARLCVRLAPAGFALRHRRTPSPTRLDRRDRQRVERGRPDRDCNLPTRIGPSTSPSASPATDSGRDVTADRMDTVCRI